MIAILLVGAVPPLATPPEQFTAPIGGSFTLAQCDGFDVIDTNSGWPRITDFYDNSGNLVESAVHINTSDQISNSVTGFIVSNTFASNETNDPAINEYFIRDVAYNVTFPGYGIVYFDSGLGIFVLVDGEFVEVQFSGKYQTDTALLYKAMNQ